MPSQKTGEQQYDEIYDRINSCIVPILKSEKYDDHVLPIVMVNLLVLLSCSTANPRKTLMSLISLQLQAFDSQFDQPEEFEMLDQIFSKLLND